MPSRAARGLLASVLVVAIAGCAALPDTSPRAPTPSGPDATPLGRPNPSPAPDTGPPATSPAGATADALVPIVGFWSTRTSITMAELGEALAGRDPAYPIVAVESSELAGLASRLDVVPGPQATTADAAHIARLVASQASALGVVRAAEVTPGVRALAVDGAALFGEQRVASLDDWPLLVGRGPSPVLPVGTPSAAFDPAGLWTLAAAGDVMLDRQPYLEAVRLGKGTAWPWAGGRATITGSACCAVGGGGPPVGRRIGDQGAVADLFRDADLAMVNLEGPAPDAFTYHPDGFTFTMDPALLSGLVTAGIDFVSLGNNHIANAGPGGIADTLSHLDALGIGHAGAGADLATARRPAWYTVDGLRVAVLAYNGTGLGGAAAPGVAGAAPLVVSQAVDDIRAARAAGAGLVVVWPHWGIEYTAATTASQRAAAAAMVAAGADLILGNHSHWAGPLAWMGDRLVVYSLGDFIFDLERTWQTMESVVIVLTFAGRRLVQVELHPTLILDGSQPNLLDPSGDGRVVLGQMRQASAALP